jgi:hypothetical protein
VNAKYELRLHIDCEQLALIVATAEHTTSIALSPLRFDSHRVTRLGLASSMSLVLSLLTCLTDFPQYMPTNSPTREQYGAVGSAYSLPAGRPRLRRLLVSCEA